MAYAAVLSLNQNLEQISNPHLEQHKTPLQDQQIKFLQEKLSFLLDFLDDSWQRRSEELRCLEREIRDVAYKAEDMVESHISKNFGEEDFQERQMRDQTFCVNFKIVADEIDCIKTKADKLKELWGATDVQRSQRSTSLPTGQSSLLSIGKNATVGLHNDLIQIMDRLTGYPPSLEVIPVTGMGGIGKTTLARNVYDHPQIEFRFHTRAWASISQEYREREVLLSLLDSMKQFSAEKDEWNNTEKDKGNSSEVLKERVYKSLKGRRYLVVMDDVWTTEAWVSLRRIFPDDGIGSRIMLTTRLSNVVDSHYSPYRMQFLNETDSWSLLCQKVFGEDSCSIELEEAGKEIAENCKGLPLSLVVIGGHLKANRTRDHWEYVAQNVKSVVNETDANCSEILSLSYDYLPNKLKACFLYMGVFPEDHKIRVSKLIKLWVAEGFLKPVNGKTLEEVAEEYLGDLISRNLIMISKKSSRGKIKTCSIHDMLRDLCVRKAQEEKFFHVIVTDKDFRIFAEGIKYSRRLCINPDIFHKELSNSDNSNVNPSMGSLPPVRSILCFCLDSEIYESGDRNLFPLLRVLDLGEGKVDGFPIGETKLVHTRYLSFSCDGEISIPKILPDSLWYLQTLIVDHGEVHLPEEIWRMPHLRHLLFWKCYLPCPATSPIDGENLVLGNLLTLSKVSSSSCTKEVFERVPNLNKLGIRNVQRTTTFSLGDLVDLTQLETLKIRGVCTLVNVQVTFTFPPNIKKLTLESGRIPWKDMTIVGSMPNLEVLKLRYDAFDGSEWEPTEGQFCKLKFLLLDKINLAQWRANNTHFRSLERLILRRCFKLEEIPLSFGEIQTLQSIDLDDASPSAVTSAMKIQEELKDWGNDSFQVHVLPTFQDIHRAIKEPEAEIIDRLWSNDETLQLKATSLFSRILQLWGYFRLYDEDQIQPIEEVIPRVVPRFLEFLARDDYSELQFQAARAINGISIFLSDNINILIDHGAVPILVSLLNSPEDVLREKALETLGNIAGDSAKSRDLVLSYGVLMPLLEQLNDKTKLSIMRNATRTLSDLCRREPWPQFEFSVKSALLHLAHLIHTKDEEVLRCACWVLVHLTDWKKDIIQAMIDAGVFPRLVELLLYPSPFVLFPALRTVHNIIKTGDDIQIQVLIDNGTLPCLPNLLTQNDDYITKKVTCRIISGIIERTKDHVQAVIEAGIIAPLVQLLQNAEFRVQGEATWAIFSATMEGTNEQIKFLVDEGCIKPLCDLLVSPNGADIIKFSLCDHLVSPNGADIIKYCLGGLENILKVGEDEKNQGNTKDVNVFAQMIDDAGGLQKIKNLQTHDNSEICEEAMKILETYWKEVDDEQLRSGDAPQSG